MLVKFSCKNFRSIGNDPINLDLVVAPKIQKHPAHVCRPTDNAKVLRNAAIYGANAAGKSNVVRALGFMRTAVVGGVLPQNSTRDYCRAGQGLANREAVFEVQFVADGKAYDYGFSCILSEYRIVSEWLYELNGSDGGNSRLVFERSFGEAIRVGDGMATGREAEADAMRLRIYVEDFDAQTEGNGALLFLTSIGRGKRFDDGSALKVFERVLRWFTDGVQMMGADQPFPTSNFYMSGKTLAEVAEVLASFDTGIESLSKRVVSMEELDRHVDFGLALSIRQLMSQGLRGGEGDRVSLVARDGSAFVGVERDGTGEPVVTILEIGHRKSAFDFEFGDESDGTKRLFDFMDMLFAKGRDAVFVVDEIDRSLHPMLTQHFVTLFNEVHKDDRCQLVFTTHESSLMSYDYFRKDEVWFVDRNDEGFSRLYPLDDFEEVRSDSRLSKQYLEGRYGGIPALSLGRALAALCDEEV